MKIGIDIDEVLADQLSSLIRFHNDSFGTTLARDHFRSSKFWETWGGTREEAIRKVYDFYQTPYFRDIQPVDGSKEAVGRLSRDHELHLVTGRQNDIATLTQDWIRRHFPNRFSGIHFANHYSNNGFPQSKAEICDALGIEFLIEDTLDYALECARPNRKILLLDYPWNQTNDLPEGIHRVHSWKGVLDFLR
jgi:uncharacterized HAD superfamily protein